jgi:hypothetical protein
MFWRVASISHTSAVEAILDKGVGSFTLEELLEEDDLIQVSFFGQIEQLVCWCYQVLIELSSLERSLWNLL